jgi:hypothetical protein
VASSKCWRTIGAASMTLVALALTTSSASAGDLVNASAPCENQTFNQPFAPWLDPAQYTLAPDGALENGAPSWSLADGAALSTGNETYSVHGAGDTTSVSLPSGSSATSGAMCVGIDYPSVRFFAKRTGGTALGRLRVDVLFEDASGTVRSLPIGLVAGNGSWAPTAPMLITANLLALLSGGQTAVAFRFVPQSNSSWSVDDVYVDPFRNH